MWIVANGAMKSGSTWIFQLFSLSEAVSQLPKEFQNPGWSNPSVAHGCLRSAAKTMCSSSSVYVTKQHWRNKNSFLMSLPGIKVFNIIRDIRDVIVSRYYHDVRKFGFQGDIEKFLNEKLDFLVQENCEYHSYWMDAPELHKNSYYITAYEYLLVEYEKAAHDMFAFSGISLTDQQREKTLQRNIFQNKPVTGEGKFFRKGKAFSFSEDLHDGQVERILECAHHKGLLEAKKKIADFNPVLRPYLKQTDLGL